MKFKIFSVLAIVVLVSALACEQQQKTEEQEETVSKIDTAAYLKKGQTIAGATFAVMSGELQAALKEGGVANAVKYCNLAALPIADSLSKVHDATIRRTTNNVRNPKDAPNSFESAILTEYQKDILAGKDLKPMVRSDEEGYVHFFAPIKVNAFCLQCHGKVGETLSEEDYTFIKEYYPEDQAVGYVEGDFRGMWSIKFRN